MLRIKIISILISLLLITGLSFGQFSDTLAFDVFVVEDSRITTEEPYKKTALDSLLLSRYKSSMLAEVLQNETPIFIKSYGQGAVSSISFRGTGASHTQLYWNGIPINSPVLGMSDVSILPAFFFNDVEVHYGLSSLVDGAGGLGGALQLNNTSNWDDKLNFSISTEAGSYGFYSFGFQESIKIKKTNIQSGFLWRKAENNFEYKNLTLQEEPIEKQQNASYDQVGFYQNFYYKLNSKNQFSIKYNYFNSDRNLPKLITQQNSDENLVDISFRSVAEWNRVSASSFLSVQAGYWREILAYQFPTNNIYSSYQTDNFVANVNYKKQLGSGLKLNIVYNGGYTTANNKYYETSKHRTRNALMFSLTRSFYNKLLINFLVREEVVNNVFSPVLPSFGINYKFGNPFAVKYNIARTYRFPSFNDLYWEGGTTQGNPNLLPEDGWSTEAGIEFAEKNKQAKIKTELTGYYSNITNWIIWLPNSENVWMPQNKKNVTNSGLEFIGAYSYDFRKLSFDLKGSYALTSSVTHEQEGDFQLIYVPYHQYKITGTVTYDLLSIVYNHVYTDRRYITTDNNWYMPDYQLGNMSINVTKPFKSNTLQVGFNINNLWNKAYQSIAWRPMPGRNYAVKLTYVFKR